jgi:hypothetical protein
MDGFIRLYAVDSKQDVIINVDHIIKVSSNTDPGTCEKWTSFINCVGNGTVRVGKTVDEIEELMRGAYL